MSIKPLHDKSPMPFGKFKGEPMEDVPASYLHWLWSMWNKHSKQLQVADYIERNKSALEKEYSNGIW